MKSTPRFTSESIAFLKKAGRQKREDWLDKHADEFLAHVREPLQNLAIELAKKLRPHAPGYRFPTKGLGRIKRNAIRAQEYGSLYKNYVSFTITTPAQSRFDHNPSLFFMINSDDDEGDEVLLAGGLYLPSSRQLKAIRERIAESAEPFEKLFKSKPFAASFPDGFSLERSATRPPRGFPKEHPKMEWLKLQGYFVWRSYRKKEYTSPDFPKLVAKDGEQILRLNELLHRAIAPGKWSGATSSVGVKAPPKTRSLSERVGEDRVRLHTPDF